MKPEVLEELTPIGSEQVERLGAIVATVTGIALIAGIIWIAVNAENSSQANGRNRQEARTPNAGG